MQAVCLFSTLFIATAFGKAYGGTGPGVYFTNGTEIFQSQLKYQFDQEDEWFNTATFI